MESQKEKMLILSPEEFVVLAGGFSVWFRAAERNIPPNKMAVVGSVMEKLGFVKRETSKIQVVRM